MTTFYQAQILDTLGNRLATVANFAEAGLQYVLNCTPGAVGVCELTVPRTFPIAFFQKDGRIAIERALEGRPPSLDNGAIYLIRKRQVTTTTTTITAYHATSLLARRIVAYVAGSSYSDKSAAAAETQIKTFVAQNMGSSISAANRVGSEVYADVSAYLSAAADSGAGASIAKAAAWRNLLDVLTEIAEASALAGTYMTFEVFAPSESQLELRTYPTARGVDHRASSGQPVILSVDRGNLENVVVMEDWTEEATFTIAGGQGEAASRLVTSSYDADRIAESPFARIERFVDASNIADLTQLQDEADAALRDGRPVVTVSGDLVETAAATRGIHFDLGDMITVEAHGVQYDMRLDVIHQQIGALSDIGIAVGAAEEGGDVVHSGGLTGLVATNGGRGGSDGTANSEGAHSGAPAGPRKRRGGPGPVKRRTRTIMRSVA